MCIFHAGNLSDDLAGESLCTILFFTDFDFGVWDNSYILHACLYAVFFYHFTTGMENGTDGSGGFPFGEYNPSAFFPPKYLALVELSPFAYMQNVPFRIYSGELAGTEIYLCILKQIFWLAALMLLGIVVWKRAEKRVILQGG